MLALPRRHVAEHAEGATHLLFALRIHGAQLLRRTEEGLTLLRAEAFEVFVAADRALALVGRHRVQLMKTIDEALLLLLRQGIEARLAAKRVFLAGKRLTLMALQPGAEMRADYVSWSVWTTRRAAIWAAGTVDRTRNKGAGHG